MMTLVVGMRGEVTEVKESLQSSLSVELADRSTGDRVSGIPHWECPSGDAAVVAIVGTSDARFDPMNDAGNQQRWRFRDL